MTIQDQLFLMCANRRMCSLEALKRSCADIHATNSHGKTALDIAIMHVNMMAVSFLLDRVDIKTYPVSRGGRTLLMTASSWLPEHAATKHGNTIDYLLRNQADINAADKDGWTALMHAFANGEHLVARQLLRAGASVCVADKYGTTLAHLAASRGSVQLFRLLSEFNADVNAADKRGVTPLMLACEPGEATSEAYAIADASDWRYRMRPGYSLSASSGPVAMLLNQKMFKTVANVHAADSNGCTALSYASAAGCWRSVVMLMRADADAKVVDNFGKSAVAYAYTKRAQKPNIPDVRDFLNDLSGEKRAKVNFGPTMPA